MPTPARNNKVLRFARKHGVIHPRDITSLDPSRMVLTRLVRSGKMERVGRGIYRLAGGTLTEHASLVEACKRVPDGVICLLSALAFHNLTTQAPHEVWLAIDRKSWKPRNGYPPLRIARFSQDALAKGIKVYKLEGVAVPVYTAAKTVADCFKYRNKIGIDVAVEALRDYRKQRKGTMADLWRFAEVCRVTRIIRPYLEAMQ